MIPPLTSLGRASMFTKRTEEGLSPLTGRERSRTRFTEGVISAPALEKGWQFGKGWGGEDRCWWWQECSQKHEGHSQRGRGVEVGKVKRSSLPVLLETVTWGF